MTELNTAPDDALSALMDGELHGLEQQSAMDYVMSDRSGLTTWHAYHVTGDVLRSEELAGAAQDLHFWTQLEAKLAQEPRPASLALPAAAEAPLRNPSARSANSPFFWRAVAGAACSVLVAVLGVSIWSSSTNTPAPVTLAQSEVPAPVVVAVDSDGMIRDPRLDQLLNAHQQLGGHSALQMPSGFLRNATYEGGGR